MEKRSHINTGIRKLLEIPQMYNLKRIVFGGEKYRRWYVSSFNLKTGDRILDIGCGTGHILKYLPDDVEYHGVDMEEDYISFCRSRYGYRASFYHEKVGEKDHSEWHNHFDVINMHGLIHHLDDNDSLKLMQLVFDYLVPGGNAFTADSLYHENQTFVARWLVSKDRGQNIRTPEQYLALARQKFIKVESRIIENYARFPYSLFYMKLQKI